MNESREKGKTGVLAESVKAFPLSLLFAWSWLELGLRVIRSRSAADPAGALAAYLESLGLPPWSVPLLSASVAGMAALFFGVVVARLYLRPRSFDRLIWPFSLTLFLTGTVFTTWFAFTQVRAFGWNPKLVGILLFTEGFLHTALAALILGLALAWLQSRLRPVGYLLAIGLVAASALCAFQRKSDDGSDSPVDRHADSDTLRLPKIAANAPSILLITIDTLRADRISGGGDSIVHTPALSKLEREGVSYSAARSVANITVPSHVSMMTSLYPADHGIVDHVHRLDPRAVTLAEVLSAAGYETLAATSVFFLDRASGLGQGFQEFSVVNLSDSRDLSRSIPDRQDRYERSAAETVQEMIRLLSDTSGPFFAWLHLFDPHVPYAPPEPFHRLYYRGDPRNPEITSMDRIPGLHPVPVWLDGVTDIEYPLSQYRAEVSYVDHQIAKLLRSMSSSGFLDDTAVLVTSDHGESFGSHGAFFTHLGIFDTELRVPLIVRPVPANDAGQNLLCDLMVESVDLFPTIMSLASLDPGLSLRGSALPLTQEEISTASAPGPAFAEHANAEALALAWKEHKLILPQIRSRVGHRPSLFHLISDPGERVNLYSMRQELVREMTERLSALKDRSSDQEALSQPAARPQEERELLRALGYLQ